MPVLKMQCKNRVLEPWLDYHIRRYRAAKELIAQHAIEVRGLIIDKRKAWTQHISRFALDGRETHLLKNIILWRSLDWWRYQQGYIDNDFSSFRHPSVFTARRWEAQFPRNWVNYFSSE